MSAAAVSVGQPTPPGERSASGVTTIVLVRHAEKANDHSTDPALSPTGQARAMALAAALKDANVAAIYSTPFKRTKATAEPVAKRFGLPVTERNSTATALAQEVLAHHGGKVVLIVGHSNTVPDLVKSLSAHRVRAFTESEFDRIFIITRPRSGPAPLIETRYGQSAPGFSLRQ
jgi:broad specificity phosphatase PhoE